MDPEANEGDQGDADAGSDSDDGASALEANDKTNQRRGIGTTRQRRQPKVHYDDGASNQGEKSKIKPADKDTKKNKKKTEYKPKGTFVAAESHTLGPNSTAAAQICSLSGAPL